MGLHVDVSSGQSRKGCQVLNLCVLNLCQVLNLCWELVWLEIWPPVSVQSWGVHIVSLLHYSWEHTTRASNLHRHTYPAQARVRRKSS